MGAQNALLFYKVHAGVLATLQGELLGELGGDVHAILQPGQLRAGKAFGVASQASSDARLPGLAFWVHLDDGRNWNKVEQDGDINKPAADVNLWFFY